jgi:hypothetical protein
VFLYFLIPGDRDEFSVFGLIWHEILAASWTTTKSCLHGPYIMKMIEVVTKLNSEKESVHEAYVPLRIFSNHPTRRSQRATKALSPRSSRSPVPSLPRYPIASRAASASREPTRHSGHSGFTSFMKKSFKALYSICADPHMRSSLI